MDSISKKLEGLQGQFQELVTKGGISNFIKFTLDAGTALFKFANSDIGRAIIQTTVLTSAIKLLGIAGKAVLGTKTLGNTIKMLGIIITSELGFTGAVSAATKALWANAAAWAATPFGTATIIIASIASIAAALSSYSKAQEQATLEAKSSLEQTTKQFETIEELKNSLKDETLTRNELLSVMKNHNSAYAEELSGIEDINLAREESVRLLDEEARAKAEEITRTTGSQYTKQSKYLASEITPFERFETISGTPKEVLQQLGKVLDDFAKKREEGTRFNIFDEKFLKTLEQAYEDIGTQVKNAEQIVSDYESALSVLNGTYESNNNAIEENNNLIAQQQVTLEEIQKNIDDVQSIYDVLNKAVEEYNSNGEISVDTWQSILALGGDYLNLLTNENGQLVINADSYETLNQKLQEETVATFKAAAWNDLLAMSQRQVGDSASTAISPLDEAGKAALVAGQNALKGSDGWLAFAQAQAIATNTDISGIDIDAWANKWAKAFDTIGVPALSSSKGAAKSAKSILETQKSQYDALFSYMNKQIDKEIDLLKKQKEEEEQYWDDKINALKEQNKAIEDQISLEKAQQALAEAKSKKVLIFKDGGFQYAEDVQAISEAQENLESIQRQQQLEAQTKALEDQKTKSINAINAQIKKWEEYKKEWSSVASDYEDSQNELIASQILGISLEGDNWKTRLGNLQSYVNSYNSILSQMKSSSGGGGGSVSPPKSTTSTSDKSNMYYDSEEKKWVSVPKRYATGTTGAKETSVSMVGEQGREIRVVNKGDGIIPHNITENLMALGKYTPVNLMNKLSSAGSGSNVYQYSFDKLVLPNVSDANSFINALKNFKPMAIQAGSSR